MAHLSLRFLVAAAAFPAASAASRWVPAVEKGADGAVSGCPCLSNNSNIFHSIKFLQSGVPRASSCRAWDNGVNSLWSQCLASDAIPRWCSSDWCYVNATNCNRRWAASKLVDGLEYSYETCGFLDHFKTAVRPWNDSRPIYAFAFGYQAELEPNTGSQMLDLHLSFAYRVLLQAEIKPQSIFYRKDVSETSLRQVGNPYSGCVLDVAVGEIDICFGDVWDTAERQSFGAASFIQVSQEDFYLIGRPISTEEESLYDVLRKPFEPFHLDLWFLVAGVIFVVGLAMLVFEFHSEDGDFQGHNVGFSIFKSLYLAFLSFVNSGGSFTAVTASGRIVSIGFGMFILISVAAFTASTADFLISKSMNRNINSLERVLQEGSYKICYGKTLRDHLETKYPDMRQHGVPLVFPTPHDFYSAIEQGKCQYCVSTKSAMGSVWSSGEMCDLQLIGQTLMSAPVGYFVTEELRALISWAVVVKRTQGVLADIEAKFSASTACSTQRRLAVQSNFLVRRLGASASTSFSRTDSTSGVGPESLGASHMFGACFVVATSIAVAAIVRLGQIVLRGMGQGDKDLASESVEMGRQVGDKVTCAAEQGEDAAVRMTQAIVSIVQDHLTPNQNIPKAVDMSSFQSTGGVEVEGVRIAPDYHIPALVNSIEQLGSRLDEMQAALIFRQSRQFRDDSAPHCEI